jgi:hypothetical protein
MTTIFLVAHEGEAHGHEILGELGRGDILGDTAGVRHPLPEPEARADVAAWLAGIDRDWANYVDVL